MEIRSNLNNNRISFGSNAGKVLSEEVVPHFIELNQINSKNLNPKIISEHTNAIIQSLDKFEKSASGKSLDLEDKVVLEFINQKSLIVCQNIMDGMKESLKIVDECNLPDKAKQLEELLVNVVKPFIEKTVI